jgi:hypothetical protein
MELALAKIPQFKGGNMVGMASHGDDSGLSVEFFIDDVYQPFLSHKEGRAIYHPVEMVRVIAPGSKSEFVTRVHHPAPGPEDQDRAPRQPWSERFPRQYAAFKAQQEQVPDGIPLEMCKFLPSHRVKELKAANVHTAEQYAAMPDSIVQTLGMGASREKQLCQQYISNDDQKTASLSRALAEAQEAKADVQMLKDQLAQLNAMMAGQMAAQGKIYPETLETVPAPKRGPGRPPKGASDDAA